MNPQKKLLNFFLVSIFVVLSGCVNVYQPPLKNEPTSKLGVKNTYSGLGSWMNFSINAIDNKSSGLQLLSPSNLRVHPGKHIFTIFVNFNTGLFKGPFEALVDIEADLKANQVYSVQGAVKGSQVLVWISDNTGKKISPVTSSSYHTESKPIPIMIPVGR